MSDDVDYSTDLISLIGSMVSELKRAVSHFTGNFNKKGTANQIRDNMIQELM